MRTHALLAATLIPAAAAGAGVTLQIDYSLDANGFFNPGTTNGAAARAALNAAADYYTDRFLDTPTAITPGGSNSWTPLIRNPATGLNFNPPANPTIPAGTILVYAGGRDEPGDTLGIGGPGGFSASGNQAFFDSIRHRGQAGSAATPPTDFAPWGGSIGFDSGTAWNFSVANLPAGNQNDFLSVAIHELGHLLGFGTSASFTTFSSGGVFTGPKSRASNGNADVPLGDSGHFSDALLSPLAAGGAGQPLVMGPSIVTGTRNRLTLLDFAGFDDLGWDLARPGDANADGGVNFPDLLALASNYNQLAGRTWSEGDFNYDGATNFPDLLVLASNYNLTGPLPLELPAEMAGTAFAADFARAMSMVPEPTGVTAILAAGAAALRRRR